MKVDKLAAPTSPEGKPLGSCMLVENTQSTKIPPLRLGGPWATGCTRKSSAREVTYLNTIVALGGLTSEFPWDHG